MQYKDLKKMTAVKLREEITTKFPDVTGVSAMKKDQLVELMADRLGIDRHAHGELAVDKTAIKQRIRALKKERDEALSARDRAKLKEIQHKIHKQKHTLRKAVKEAERVAKLV